jgi:type I restriction enzyme S subunit
MALDEPRHDVVHFKFLYFALTARGLRDTITGAAQPQITRANLERVKVPLPALTEQRRIVELLEQADGMRRKRTEADALANRILPALFLKMFGEPAMNPKGWPTKSTGRAFRMVSGGTPSKANVEFWNGDIPWVSPKDMKSVILTDTEDHITEDAIKNSATSLVPEGAVMMVVRSGILAHSVPVALAGKPMAINQDLKGMVPNPEETEEIKPYYMLAWLLTAKQTLLGCVKRGATVHSIDSGRFQALPFMLPPPSLQDAFARQFENLLALQAKQTAGGRDVERLFATMLHRAFTGELTAKWRQAHMKELLAEMEQQARLQEPPPEE